MIFNTEDAVFMNDAKEGIKRIGIRWGGIAGDGLQSMGISLAKYFNKLGFFSIGFPGTQSTIRGGHIWFHLEISDNSFHSYDRTSDILIALNEQSVEIHLTDLKIGGILIINSDTTSTEKYDSEIKRKKILVFNVPMTTITRKIDKKLDILKNTVIIGFLLKLLNLNRYEYSNSIKIYFKSKSKVINANIEALERGYLLFDDLSFDPSTYKLEPGKLQKNENIIITGNEAIALGAIVSDLKFLAQYPITPASSILKFIAQHADKFKIVVKQVEDEISAIISITAASWTGVRAMTATSGPGFSLMAEGLGYAGMTETPIVIVLSQRAGPSTGVPTKIEQADLLPALFSSHGEFPRCIIAPRNVQECFDATVKAFNIADRYSLPVIILTDFSLSEQIVSNSPFNLNVPIDRGYVWKKSTVEDPEFKRFKLTEDGVSPRALPGTENGVHVLVGAEHDEHSNSLSGNRCGLPLSGELREKMTRKRFQKLHHLQKEMDAPRWYGEGNADYTLICWGSTENACKESVDRLNNIKSKGLWNLLSFKDLYPFPSHLTIPELKKIKKGIIIECNFTGQFEKILYLNTGWRPLDSLRFISGETPTGYEIVMEIISKYSKIWEPQTPISCEFLEEAWH